MSGAVTPISGRRALALLMAGRARLGPPGSRLRRLGPAGAMASGLLALLLWAFVGSLVLGLRNPAVASPLNAGLWLAGAGAIAALALAAGILASGNS
jgi:hypothetical protein